MAARSTPLSLLRCTSSRLAASTTPSSSSAARRSFTLLRSQSSFPSSSSSSPSLLSSHRRNAKRTPIVLEAQKRTFVPYVIDEGARGQTDLYSRLLKERVICMSEVEDSMSTIIVASLLYLDAADPTKPIYLYINSPGGVVTSGLAIYDTMQFISAPVHTFCIGQAASMGSLLLAGGAAGHRYILPNARVMIHQPSGGAGGQATDFEITAKEILRMRAALTDIYRVHCSFPGETPEQSRIRFDTAMERDRFMTPEESKAFGLVDHIQDSRKMIGEEGEEGAEKKEDA